MFAGTIFMPLTQTPSMRSIASTLLLGARMAAVLAMFSCLIYSKTGLAQELDDETDEDPVLGSEAISWMPGEQYDPKFGTMNYSTVDLSLPGNGKLPIVVRRTFNQRQSGSTNRSTLPFGLMDLATPKLFLEMNRKKLFSGCRGERGNGFHNKTPPMKFSDGANSVVFYHVTDDNKHLVNHRLFDGEIADFVSKDNWIVKCRENAATSAGIGNQRLDVFSPDGIRYQMKGGTPRAQSVRDRMVFYVIKVSDAYGNTLTYDYMDWNTKKHRDTWQVTKIVANDGRQVDFEYEPVPNQRTRRVKRIVSKGLPNPRELNYSYGNSSYLDLPRNNHVTGNNRSASIPLISIPNISTLNVTENGKLRSKYKFKEGRLLSITNSTGAGVAYQYSGDRKFSGPERRGRYDMLYSRQTFTHPDKGFYYFSYHKESGSNWFSRLIRTSSAAIEFRFGDLASGSLDRSTNYTTNSGKLIEYKVFNDPNVVWSANATKSLLLSRRHSYKSEYKLASYSAYLDERIVLSRQDVTVYAHKLGMHYNSVFTTEYPEYDSRGYPTTIVSYTSNGRKFRTTTMRYKYYGFNTWRIGKLDRVDIDGKDVTETYYNYQGDVEKIVKNGKTLTELVWHTSGSSKGEVYKVINGQGGATTYSNYFRGKPQQIIDASYRARDVVVNSDGTVSAETRPGSRAQTRYLYDKSRRLVGVTPARTESDITILFYSADNRTIRNSGTLDERRLDEYGRTVVDAKWDSTHERWSTVKFEYDVEGRLIFESIPHNASPTVLESSKNLAGVAYEYDGLGRLVKTSRRQYSATEKGLLLKAETSTYEYSIAPNGNLTVAETDPRGLLTRTEYESFGSPSYRHPVSIKEADGTISTIARNSLGNVDNHTRGGMTTSYLYNDQNLVREMTRPDDGTTHFEYYDDGSLHTRTNNGRRVTYRYSPDLKILQEDHVEIFNNKGVIREFGYDINGNLAIIRVQSHDDPNPNSISYTYDEANNLKIELLSIDGFSMEMSYDYDGRSNLKRIRYPNGNSYDLAPNAFGDPTKITESLGDGKIIYDAIRYHPNNTVEVLSRASHQVRTTQDAWQRPKIHTIWGPRINLLASREYTYDRSNNVNSIVDNKNARTSNFTYDNRNRLKTATISNADNWEFEYSDSDDIDWVKHGLEFYDYKYKSNTGQLKSVIEENGHTKNFEYDNGGNMTLHSRKTDSNTITQMRLDFDAAYQVAGMSDGTKFAYDARGIRVKKDLNGPIYSFYNSSEKLIYRHDTGAGVTSEYFYVNGKLVARQDEDVSGSSIPVSNPVTNPVTIPVSTPVVNTPTSVPSTPALAWPSGPGAMSNATYKWGVVSTATVYNVEVQTGAGAVALKKSYGATESGCTNENDPKHCLVKWPAHPVSGANRWRVQAGNAKGVSPWSVWREFSGPPTPVAPVVTSPVTPAPVTSVKPLTPATLWPSGESVGSNPEYIWRAVAAAKSYTLEIQNVDSGKSVFAHTLGASSENCSMDSGQCKYYKPDLRIPGDHRWRVKAVNGDVESVWSGWRDFSPRFSVTAAVPPLTPATAWPRESGAGRIPLFTWRAVDNASQYEVEVKNSANTTVLGEKVSAVIANCSSGKGDCQTTWPTLPVAGYNSWRVKAIGSAGNSQWSDWRSFNVTN